MNYDIIPTLGPACQPEETIRALREAGATGFRLNVSHLTPDELEPWRERLVRALGDGPPPPLVLDLQGSKWRLGRFPPFLLRAGDRVELCPLAETEAPGLLPVPHPDFFQAAAVSGGEIVLNDAKSSLVVERAESERILARVRQDGIISPHKGITFAHTPFRKEALSPRDAEVVRRSREWAVAYALSYVKDAAEMATYRQLLGPRATLIAKLERESALAEVEGIAAEADALWLCRGDLGAEVGPRPMAEAVHRLSERVVHLPRPVLLAGQVLEHMTESPAPTRSELCYLHDALVRGYRGVVLSDETAIGRFPVEACRTAALFR